MAAAWASAIGLPDPMQQPDKWNAVWELRLANDPLDGSTLEELLIKEHATDPEYLYTNIRYNLRHLCQLQHVLSQEGRIAFDDGFEAKWKQSFKQTRQKHLLEGLVRAQIMNPEAEGDRLYCSDLTINAMNDKDGEAFLHVLRTYMSDDILEPPSTPRHYPHPKLSSKLEKAREKDKNGFEAAVWESVQISRDLLICRFIVGTLGSFYNEPRPPPPIVEKRRVGGPDKYSHEIADQLKAVVGRDVYKTIDGSWKEKYKETVRSCDKCGKFEAEGEVLKQCQRCMEKVKRRVFYCSKQCQSDDWPVHKKMCGKPMTLDIAKDTVTVQPVKKPPQTSTLMDTRIPPPSDGYTRSPALQTQIRHLESLDSKVTYVLFSADGVAHPVTMHDSAVGIAFMDTRNEAFKTGKLQPVLYIAQYLLRYGARLTRASIPSSDIVKQLTSEYPGVEIVRGVEMLERTMAEDPKTKGRLAIDIEADRVNTAIQAQLQDKDSVELTRQILLQNAKRDGSFDLMQRYVQAAPSDDPKAAVLKDVLNAMTGDADLAEVMKAMDKLALNKPIA